MVEHIEADFDHVPGTVHLVDVVRRVSPSTRHDASQTDIVLVPQPSPDPEDPLNWSHRRKLFALSMALLYVLGTGIATSLQYSVLANITADTGISTDNLVQGTGIMFLFFGWACLFWQPIALTYGRRGVYLITMFLTVPIMWFAHRILIGIVVSPIESLCEVTVFDLFFAHNRGTYMGIYVFTLFGSNFLAPLVAGWFNDAYGWRWTMNLGTIICSVVFIVMFLSMEETIYFRRSTLDGISIEMEDTNTHAAGPKSLTPAKVPRIAQDDTVQQRIEVPTRQSSKSRLSRYSLFQPLPGRPSNRDMLHMMYRPLVMIYKFPTVAWTGFLYGINLAWYNVLNGTASPVLTGKPYEWSAAQVGCVYAGPIVGAALACMWSGKIADRITLALARRNNGIREPEHRLWVLSVSGIISAAGLVTWGVGAYHEVHWIGLVFGLGILTFGCVTGGSIAVSYNVDCFKEIAGETMVSIMIIRNTIGFGFSYAITPWWTTQGLQNCFIVAAVISLVCTSSFLVLIKYGKQLRRRSIPAYQKYMSTAAVSQD